MNCDAFSPRLTAVKQTYGRHNKSKKPPNVNNGPPNQTSVPARALQLVVPKKELLDFDEVIARKQYAVPCPPPSRTIATPSTPPSSRVQPVTQSTIRPQIASTSQTYNKQTSFHHFTSNSPSPLTLRPLILTPPQPRPVPNILRRTPVKQGSGSPRKPTTPKSKSVNLSPVLYSPTLKKKNQFITDMAGASNSSSKARIITSYVKVLSPNKKSAPSPKKKSMGSQCNINSPRVLNANPSAVSLSRSCSSPNHAHPSSGESIVCNIDLKSDDMILVSHTINGQVYSGILVADSVGTGMSTVLNCGYLADQLPSQYHKKLKARLGLSFDSGCDSENSDSESAKTKLQKLKYSDYKAMKNSIAGSADQSCDNEDFPTNSVACTAVVPTSRQNVPYQSNANHNKKSISGLSDYLREAAATPNEKLYPTPKEGADKSKALKQSQCKPKDQSKTAKPQYKSVDQPSPKKQKSEKAEIISDGGRKPKLKFGEKFVKPKQVTPPKGSIFPSSVPESPEVIETKLAEVSRHYKMRSHSTEDKKQLSSVLALNSSKLKFVDLEWPMWCPRKLKLVINPVRRGKPARFKLERNGSKRRRTESNDSNLSDKKEDIFTENHNPFGIGDVVIAKRTQGNGRPYWPGKVLSVTGLTVCVLFYNTPEVMQIAKCNVEWYYDGCQEHRISYEPNRDSQVWKAALEEADGDVKRCIGVDSVVWGLYEDEWWPALVTGIDNTTYTVQWLDDKSLEPLPLSSISPFLLSYNVRYSVRCVEEHNNYAAVVRQAHSEAIRLILDTETESDLLPQGTS